jgi:NCAIR mutase (PurE)-related protein
MTGDATREVQLDFDRRRRIGLDEAVFAEGKTTAQLEAILGIAHERGAPLLLTRLSPEKRASISPQWAPHLDYCAVSRSAFFRFIPTRGDSVAEVAIVVAGSSDAGVAREAERTLAYNGVASQPFVDVGVAGLWRLTRRIEELSRFPVVIAVAGMDAALPTVLGGLIPGVIVAVPTSVGYGVAAGGHTALHAILASCAPGISVVNIDNGYGAACVALRVLRMRSAATPRCWAGSRGSDSSNSGEQSLTVNTA